MTVGEPDVRVGMAESIHLAERPENLRLPRLIEVEQPRPSGMKTVRQQVSIGGHLVLGVMRMRSGDAGRNRRDDGAVVRGARIGIDHREEVARLLLGVAGPHEQV